jgi:hypothetical protein
LYKLFGNNIIRDVAINYNSSYEDVLSRPEFIPEIKEKFKIEKGYILTEGQNYKLMNLLHLYIECTAHLNIKMTWIWAIYMLNSELQFIREKTLKI